MKLNKLTNEEKAVILDKQTEAPFKNKYDEFFEIGKYVCRMCDNPLYSSQAKFNSGCGWPSFDDCFENAVEEVPDKDGIRTEIICARCKGHLGHVFKGERFTKKDTWYCVNSVSMKFIQEE